MIIGNGLIAKVFKKEKKYFKNIDVFASGVSNSQNKNIREFKREKKLINKHLKEKKFFFFIYFSTLDVYRKIKTPYIKHKIDLEKLLLKKKNVLIVRLSQLIGRSKNKYTIFNYLKFNLKKNNKLIIFKEFYRNFIDVDDLVNYIKKINFETIDFKILNIFNKRSIQINEILKYFVRQNIVKNKIFKLNFKKDNFYFNTSKFCKERYFFIDQKNYYKKLFNKYTL